MSNSFGHQPADIQLSNPYIDRVLTSSSDIVTKSLSSRYYIPITPLKPKVGSVIMSHAHREMSITDTPTRQVTMVINSGAVQRDTDSYSPQSEMDDDSQGTFTCNSISPNMSENHIAPSKCYLGSVCKKLEYSDDEKDDYMDNSYETVTSTSQLQVQQSDEHSPIFSHYITSCENSNLLSSVTKRFNIQNHQTIKNTPANPTIPDIDGGEVMNIDNQHNNSASSSYNHNNPSNSSLSSNSLFPETNASASGMEAGVSSLPQSDGNSNPTDQLYHNNSPVVPNTTHSQDQPADVQQPKKTTCSCSKSRCVRGYCKCYALGELCGPACGCKGCFNTPGRSKSHAFKRNHKKSQTNDTKTPEGKQFPFNRTIISNINTIPQTSSNEQHPDPTGLGGSNHEIASQSSTSHDNTSLSSSDTPTPVRYIFPTTSSTTTTTPSSPSTPYEHYPEHGDAQQGSRVPHSATIPPDVTPTPTENVMPSLEPSPSMNHNQYYNNQESIANSRPSRRKEEPTNAYSADSRRLRPRHNQSLQEEVQYRRRPRAANQSAYPTVTEYFPPTPPTYTRKRAPPAPPKPSKPPVVPVVAQRTTRSTRSTPGIDLTAQGDANASGSASTSDTAAAAAATPASRTRGRAQKKRGRPRKRRVSVSPVTDRYLELLLNPQIDQFCSKPLRRPRLPKPDPPPDSKPSINADGSSTSTASTSKTTVKQQVKDEPGKVKASPTTSTQTEDADAASTSASDTTTTSSIVTKSMSSGVKTRVKSETKPETVHLFYAKRKPRPKTRSKAAAALRAQKLLNQASAQSSEPPLQPSIPSHPGPSPTPAPVPGYHPPHNPSMPSAMPQLYYVNDEYHYSDNASHGSRVSTTQPAMNIQHQYHHQQHQYQLQQHDGPSPTPHAQPPSPPFRRPPQAARIRPAPVPDLQQQDDEHDMQSPLKKQKISPYYVGGPRINNHPHASPITGPHPHPHQSPLQHQHQYQPQQQQQQQQHPIPLLNPLSYPISSSSNTLSHHKPLINSHQPPPHPIMQSTQNSAQPSPIHPVGESDERNHVYNNFTRDKTDRLYPSPIHITNSGVRYAPSTNPNHNHINNPVVHQNGQFPTVLDNSGMTPSTTTHPPPPSSSTYASHYRPTSQTQMPPIGTGNPPQMCSPFAKAHNNLTQYQYQHYQLQQHLQQNQRQRYLPNARFSDNPPTPLSRPTPMNYPYHQPPTTSSSSTTSTTTPSAITTPTTSTTATATTANRTAYARPPHAHNQGGGHMNAIIPFDAVEPIGSTNGAGSSLLPPYIPQFHGQPQQPHPQPGSSSMPSISK